jgi:hypothetical protein
MSKINLLTLWANEIIISLYVSSYILLWHLCYNLLYIIKYIGYLITCQLYIDIVMVRGRIVYLSSL